MRCRRTRPYRSRHRRTSLPATARTDRARADLAGRRSARPGYDRRRSTPLSVLFEEFEHFVVLAAFIRVARVVARRREPFVRRALCALQCGAQVIDRYGDLATAGDGNFDGFVD